MSEKNIEPFGAKSSSETRSVFYCPKTPSFIWDLNHTTSLEIIVAVTSIACPVTIMLNLLVIIAVKTRKKLKKNSNILMSRLAVADLLVGAVSMPLTITLNALVLQKILFEDVVCTIAIISDFVLHILYNASFLSLLLIAWERYVAIVKCMKYKGIFARDRISKYVTVVWLSSLLMVAPVFFMKNVGVSHKAILAVYSIIGVIWTMCFFLLAYFYANVYLGVRKRNRTKTLPVSVNAYVNARFETKIAYTTFWVTLFAGISGLPSIVIHSVNSFGIDLPFLLEGSIFRWVETILQLNSLVNPLLYCYRDRALRNAALDLLRCRKPERIQPEALTVRRSRRRRYSVASLDVEELQIVQERPRLTRSQCFGAAWRGSNETVKEIRHRPIAAPSKIENGEDFTQQVVVTVQMENAPRKKRIQRKTESPEDTTKLELNPPHQTGGKIRRSTSLHEKVFITLTNSHYTAGKKNLWRSRSLPTNLSALDKELTVAELSI